MKSLYAVSKETPVPPWRKIIVTILISGFIVGLMTTYRTPPDDSEDPLYEVFSFTAGGFSNPGELAKRQVEIEGGWQAASGSSTARVPTKGELDRVINWLLGSTDEIVRTAAGHLRAHGRASDCAVPQRRDDQVRWSRGLGVHDMAICTIIRNEAERLPEWIAFHYLQGVGKFIVYDDGSTDEPVPRALRWLMELGIVEYERIPDDDPFAGTEELQWIQMNACLSRLHGVKEQEQVRWAAFLDVDEFMYPVQPRHASLSQLLNKRWRDVDCMYVERTYYGTSLRHRRPPADSLVISSYVMRSPLHEDGYPKVLVNLSPHLQRHVQSLYSVHAITSGEEDEEGGGHKSGVAPLSCVEQAGVVRLNHYSRSLEDYDLKIRTHYDGQARYAKDPLELFWERDRNEEFDDSASVRYACQVRALVEQLRAAHEGGSIAEGEGQEEEQEERRRG